MSTRYTPEAVDVVLLSWPFSKRPAEIKHHRAKLEGLASDGACAWIRLTLSLTETRFRLTSVEHTFPESGSNEAIWRELRRWYSGQCVEFDKVYLIAQEHVKETCYDVTNYIQRCLSGESSIADRLRGRTLFGLRQIETDAYDLLSIPGANSVVERVLTPYINEFSDLIGNTVLGFCCQLPQFLFPLKTPPPAIPWSPDLEAYLQSLWGEKLSEYMPLIFYGVYDTAAVRSAFWNGLTQRFSEICIGGLRDFCYRSGLKFLIEIAASGKSLGFDIGTILKFSDGAILVGPKDSANSNDSHDSIQRLKTNGRETLRPSISSPSPINTPKRFSVAKWVTSRRSTQGSRVLGVWRPSSPTTVQYSFDQVLGFNSWIANESENAGDRETKSVEQSTSQDVVSQFVPLQQAKNKLNGSLCLIGEPLRSVLIISPLHSFWSSTDERTWGEMTNSWAWLCQSVWDLGYDFDVASENECVDAKFDKKSRSIQLHANSYRVILVPSCMSLEESTVDLLTKVIAGRGRMVAVDPLPYLVNGKLGFDTHSLDLLLYHQRTSLLRGTAAEKTEVLKQLLNKWVKPVLQVYVKPDNVPTAAIRFQQRRAGELDLFYLFNTCQSSIESLIEFRGGSVGVEEWETKSGEKTDLDYWHANGNTYLDCSFDCLQSRLVVLERR